MMAPTGPLRLRAAALLRSGIIKPTTGYQNDIVGSIFCRRVALTTSCFHLTAHMARHLHSLADNNRRTETTMKIKSKVKAGDAWDNK
jgi:hypothetical protein